MSHLFQNLLKFNFTYFFLQVLLTLAMCYTELSKLQVLQNRTNMINKYDKH